MQFTKASFLCFSVSALAAANSEPNHYLNALRARHAYPEAFAYPKAYAGADPYAYAEEEHESDDHGLHERYAEADAYPEAYAEEDHDLDDRDLYARYAEADAYPEAYAEDHLDKSAEEEDDLDARDLYERHAHARGEADPPFPNPISLGTKFLGGLLGIGGGKEKDTGSIFERGLHNREAEPEAEAFPGSWDDEMDFMLQRRTDSGMFDPMQQAPGQPQAADPQQAPEAEQVVSTQQVSGGVQHAFGALPPHETYQPLAARQAPEAPQIPGNQQAPGTPQKFAAQQGSNAQQAFGAQPVADPQQAPEAPQVPAGAQQGIATQPAPGPPQPLSARHAPPHSTLPPSSVQCTGHSIEAGLCQSWCRCGPKTPGMICDQIPPAIARQKLQITPNRLLLICKEAAQSCRCGGGVKAGGEGNGRQAGMPKGQGLPSVGRPVGVPGQRASVVGAAVQKRWGGMH